MVVWLQQHSKTTIFKSKDISLVIKETSISEGFTARAGEITIKEKA